MNQRTATLQQKPAAPSFTPVGHGLLQAEPTTVPPILYEVLCSPGQPLDPAARAFMESRFVHNFSRVRVHTDAKAAEDSNPENVLLVARVLFVRKDGQEVLPRLLLGQPDLEEPEDPRLLPLFPLYIHRDIPFLLIGGYRVGGQGPPPLEYVEWCARDCEIRSTPLFPTNDPLASVDEFLESEVWRRLNPDDWHYRMLRLQALRAVANIYPISEQDENDLIAAATADENWSRHRRAVEALQGSWNPVASDYERGAGP